MFGCDGVQFFKNCSLGLSQAKKINNYIFYYKNLIGRGKFSQVYKGTDSRNNNPVAVKVINFQKYDKPHLLNLLYQQADILPELDHPNVIKLYSRLLSQKNCYLVMELCQQKNLEQKLKQKINLPECERIIFDIFKGLCYLQEKGIVHRDLKTANILFGTSGKAKISDFGFAIRTYSEISDIFAGTLFYMSPQSMLFQKYGPKTDIWSFAVIIYEIMHGYVPLKNCQTRQQLNMAITQPVQISSNLPLDLTQLLEGCFQLNAFNRWDIQRIKNCEYMIRLNKKYHIETTLFKSPCSPISQTKMSKNCDVSRWSAVSVENNSDINRCKREENNFYSLNNIYRDSSASNKSSINTIPNTNQNQFMGINLNYKQIICLVHYCRLINRVLQQPNGYNPQLALWLIKIINYLNSDTQFYSVDGGHNKNISSQSILKGYRNKYYAKYGQLVNNDSNTGYKNITVDTILVACTNMLRFCKVKTTEQSHRIELANVLLRQTRILKESLQHKSLQNMALSSQAQTILQKYS